MSLKEGHAENKINYKCISRSFKDILVNYVFCIPVPYLDAKYCEYIN